MPHSNFKILTVGAQECSKSYFRGIQLLLFCKRDGSALICHGKHGRSGGGGLGYLEAVTWVVSMIMAHETVNNDPTTYYKLPIVCKFTTECLYPRNPLSWVVENFSFMDTHRKT